MKNVWYKPKFLSIIIGSFLLIMDQISKNYIVELFKDQPSKIYKITSFFNVGLTWNKGITFGLFSDIASSKIIFSVIAFAIVIYLQIRLMKANNKFEIYAIPLIISGAIGNIIDRVRYGAVVDFLDLYIYNWHWPSFNIADSAICLGVIILLSESLIIRV
jgi:signal peptidase II